MKQIIDGKMYDTDKIEISHKLKDSFGEEYFLGRTNNGAIVATNEANSKIIGPEQTKVLLGYQFPDLYVELFGEVEEG